jgi:hypothetical protein
MSFVVGQIDAAPAMTYDECIALMMITLNRLEQSDLLATTEARDLQSKVNPLYANFSSDLLSYQSGSSVQSSSMDQMYSSAVVAPSNYPPRTSSGCFNCNGNHMCIDCLEPWCYVCGGDWSSSQSRVGFHHNKDCSLRSKPYSQLAQKRKLQIAGQIQSSQPSPKRQVIQREFNPVGRGQFPRSFVPGPTGSTRGNFTSHVGGQTSFRGRGGRVPSNRGRFPPRGTGRVAPLAATVDYDQSYAEESDSVISNSGEYDRAEAWMAYALSLAQPNYQNDDPEDVEVQETDERWLNDG